MTLGRGQGQTDTAREARDIVTTSRDMTRRTTRQRAAKCMGRKNWGKKYGDEKDIETETTVLCLWGYTRDGIIDTTRQAH